METASAPHNDLPTPVTIDKKQIANPKQIAKLTGAIATVFKRQAL